MNPKLTVTDLMELRVGGKYRLSRKLGCGAFGDIYHGKLDTPHPPELTCELRKGGTNLVVAL